MLIVILPNVVIPLGNNSKILKFYCNVSLTCEYIFNYLLHL